jgi:hypothetical protein
MEVVGLGCEGSKGVWIRFEVRGFLGGFGCGL